MLEKQGISGVLWSQTRMCVREIVNERFACGTLESHFRKRRHLSVDNRRPLRHNALGNDPEPELSPVWVRVPERDRAGVLFWPELHMNLAMCNQVSTLTRIFLSAIRPRYR